MTDRVTIHLPDDLVWTISEAGLLRTYRVGRDGSLIDIGPDQGVWQEQKWREASRGERG